MAAAFQQMIQGEPGANETKRPALGVTKATAEDRVKRAELRRKEEEERKKTEQATATATTTNSTASALAGGAASKLAAQNAATENTSSSAAGPSTAGGSKMPTQLPLSVAECSSLCESRSAVHSLGRSQPRSIRPKLAHAHLEHLVITHQSNISAPAGPDPAQPAAAGAKGASAVTGVTGGATALAQQILAAKKQQQPPCTPAEVKIVTGVVGGATTLAQQMLAAKKKKQPPGTPAEVAKEARNIAAITSSPYVDSVRRTPGGRTPGAKPTAINFNYDISPYRSDSGSEDEVTPDAKKKPIPDWAFHANLLLQLKRQTNIDPYELFNTIPDAITTIIIANLLPQLKRQTNIDPDKLFDNKQKTCILEDIFKEACILEDIFKGMPPAPPTNANGHARRDWRKRGSSGNWIADRITWQEEIAYKRSMGYI
eukprot:gene6037-2648_t